MAVVANSYVLGLPDRDAASFDKKSAGPLILKALAEGPLPFSKLVSVTGLDQGILKDTMTGLVNDGLVSGTEQEYAITKLGYRAQLVVSS